MQHKHKLTKIIITMSWFRQFTVLVTKNCRLIQRRPIHLLILLLSSIISVVLAWAAGRDVRGELIM